MQATQPYFYYLGRESKKKKKNADFFSFFSSEEDQCVITVFYVRPRDQSLTMGKCVKNDGIVTF